MEYIKTNWNKNKRSEKWIGEAPILDDFGVAIGNEFIDGRLMWSPRWAIMSPKSWKREGCGKLGTGYGQRYRYDSDTNTWPKVEG